MGPDARQRRWVLAMLLLLGCDTHGSDCEKAQAALRTQLEYGTKAAREVDDEFLAILAGLDESDPKATAMAENAGIAKRLTKAERDAAIAQARVEHEAQVGAAHAKLSAAIDREFLGFCAALSREDSECLSAYGDALERRRKDVERCGDGKEGVECTKAVHNRWTKANPACARLDEQVDNFFLRVD